MILKFVVKFILKFFGKDCKVFDVGKVILIEVEVYSVFVMIF